MSGRHQVSHRFSTLVLLASILFFGCTTTPPENIPSGTEIVSWLANGQYQELDGRLSRVQQGYARGAISDERLREVFRSFYFTTPSLAPNFDQWIAQFPRSYVAHLARGIYYKKIGQEARGGEFASETSSEQFQAMEQALAKASADLDQSLLLDSKPLLTYLHQLTIAQLLGDGPKERELLDRSVALDHNNYVVRDAYMAALGTRWGGSLQRMREFMEECRQAHLSAVQLGSLEAQIADDEAWNHRYVAGDVDAAVAAYEREAKLNPRGDCGPCGSTEQAANTLREAHRYPEAIKLYSKVLETDPNSIDALNGRADSENRAELEDAAFADYSRSAELGSPFAQVALAMIYLRPKHIDRKKAIEWLRKAAAQGYELAQEMLQDAEREDALMLPPLTEPPPISISR